MFNLERAVASFLQAKEKGQRFAPSSSDASSVKRRLVPQFEDEVDLWPGTRLRHKAQSLGQQRHFGAYELMDDSSKSDHKPN